MTTVDEIMKRLEDAEATLQSMLCTVTADIIMFQAAVVALRDEGILTEKTVDLMAIAAQDRLKHHDTEALGPDGAAEVSRQLDTLAERLRNAGPPVYLLQAPNDLELTASKNGNGRVRPARGKSSTR